MFASFNLEKLFGKFNKLSFNNEVFINLPVFNEGTTKKFYISSQVANQYNDIIEFKNPISPLNRKRSLSKTEDDAHLRFLIVRESRRHMSRCLYSRLAVCDRIVFRKLRRNYNIVINCLMVNMSTLSINRCS